MKKHYKPKTINITKLKSYLKNATTTTNKGHRGSNRSQCNDPKYNNLY